MLNLQMCSQCPESTDELRTRSCEGETWFLERSNKQSDDAELDFSYVLEVFHSCPLPEMWIRSDRPSAGGSKWALWMARTPRTDRSRSWQVRNDPSWLWKREYNLLCSCSGFSLAALTPRWALIFRNRGLRVGPTERLGGTSNPPKVVGDPEESEIGNPDAALIPIRRF